MFRLQYVCACVEKALYCQVNHNEKECIYTPLSLVRHTKCKCNMLNDWTRKHLDGWSVWPHYSILLLKLLGCLCYIIFAFVFDSNALSSFFSRFNSFWECLYRYAIYSYKSYPFLFIPYQYCFSNWFSNKQRRHVMRYYF